MIRNALIRHRLGLPPRALWVRDALGFLVFLGAGFIIATGVLLYFGVE